jgi:hypothetical protein
VQVRAAHRLAGVEPRAQRLADRGERVQMAAQVGDQLGRAAVVVVVCGVPEPPARGTLVVGADVELVDDEAGAGWQQLREVPAGLGQRLDVVQRRHGDRGGERAGRLVELEQRHLDDVRCATGGIDRHNVVAARGQLGGERAVAGADLQHARRRRRQRGADERVHLGRRHQARSSPRSGSSSSP